METLFPPAVTAAEVPPVPGLRYLAGYVTAAAEAALVAAIDRRPWNTEWRRRRQPYGAGYGTGGQAPPIPIWGRRLADRLCDEGVTDVPFDQMLVNEYQPGQGIAPHRDYAPFGRTVVSLSLLSACVMDFRHPARVARRGCSWSREACWCSPTRPGTSGSTGSPPGSGTSGTGSGWSPPAAVGHLPVPGRPLTPARAVRRRAGTGGGQ